MAALSSFELFIAGRYLRAKRKQAVISVITVISVLGVAAGVMALVIALAVNNGFRVTLQSNLLGATAHVSILEKESSDGIEDWRNLTQKLRALPHVKKTKMPSGNERRISGRKAVAIIDNIEAKFIGTIPQLHENVPGVGVTQRIGHCLLADTEQIHLDFRG